MKPKIKSKIEVSSSIIEEAIILVERGELPLDEYLNILNTTKKEVKDLSQKRELSFMDVLKSILN